MEPFPKCQILWQRQRAQEFAKFPREIRPHPGHSCLPFLLELKATLCLEQGERGSWPLRLACSFCWEKVRMGFQRAAPLDTAALPARELGFGGWASFREILQLQKTWLKVTSIAARTRSSTNVIWVLFFFSDGNEGTVKSLWLTFIFLSPETTIKELK